MPVSKDGCRLLYSLVRAIRPKTVVEFGTSYGISTIHLAAGVADNGVGHVWTTELNATKVAAARQNFEDAGLAASVTLLPGDALETLATVPGPIDLVLLDGWKDLYLPCCAFWRTGCARCPGAGRRQRLPDHGRLPGLRAGSGPWVRHRRVPGGGRYGDQLPG